ncbi:hypothetical protein D3C72_1672070 [compost metagenome]
MVLVGKGLHDPHAADIFLDTGVEIPHAAIKRAEILRHAAAVTAGHPGGDGHDGGGDERQRHIHRQHQQEGADEGHDGDEQVFGAVMGHLADLFEILRQPPDQMAGLLVVEITEGQLLQMVKGQTPHVGLDIDAEHVSPIGDGRHQPGIQHIDDEQPDRSGEDDGPFTARQQHVHKGLHGHRKAEFEYARQNRAGKIENEQTAIGTVIGEETAQHGMTWRSGAATLRRNKNGV